MTKPTSCRPVLVAWLVLVAWTTLPWAWASLRPPPGTAFVGTFHWIDDVYNYLSYARQAEDGALLFHNRLLLAPHEPRLAHVEWWLLGRVSRALGSRPFLAYRLLAIVLALALLWCVDLWLRDGGLPDGARLIALLMVGSGGGLGGALFELTDLPVSRCLDLSMGLYPFTSLLANPHFLAGTTLLVAALLAFERRRNALGVLLGTVLGLTRPYDLAWLGLLGGAAALLHDGDVPTRLRRLLPMTGLLPVLAYDVWLFFGSDMFASFRGRYAFPRPLDLLPALGPPLALALLGIARATCPPRRALWIWIALTGVLATLQPPSFGLQLLTGAGLPLLMLAVLAVAPYGRSWLLLTMAALLPTSLVATRNVLRSEPSWFVPQARFEAALALRDTCRPGEVAFCPPDIGLYLLGHTSCRPVASHPASPDNARREVTVRAFYSGLEPRRRQQILDAASVSYVLLPGPPADPPSAWLGPATPFRPLDGHSSPTWYARAPLRQGIRD